MLAVRTTAFLLFGCSLLSATLAAQSAASNPPRIAVVDLEVVFVRSSFGEALQQELTALEQTTLKDLEAKAKEAEELERQVDPTDQAAVRSAQRRREDLEIEARRIRDAAQRRAQKAEQEQREKFGARMQEVLSAFQTERDYELILNKSAGAVIFAGDSIDITDELLERLKS